MAKIIERLSPSQVERLAYWRDEGLRVGLATGPADRAEAELAVADAYRAAGLAPPQQYDPFLEQARRVAD